MHQTVLFAPLDMSQQEQNLEACRNGCRPRNGLEQGRCDRHSRIARCYARLTIVQKEIDSMGAPQPGRREQGLKAGTGELSNVVQA